MLNLKSAEILQIHLEILVVLEYWGLVIWGGTFMQHENWIQSSWYILCERYMIFLYDETLLNYLSSLNKNMFALLTPSYFYCVNIHIENRKLNYQWKDKIIVTFLFKIMKFKKDKKMQEIQYTLIKGIQAFLAKWRRPFKRWTRKRRMGNMIEQNSPKQRFPLMEAVKIRWLLTHELLMWKSTVKANRRRSKHQLKHTKPGLSNNPLGNQYHPRTDITIN